MGRISLGKLRYDRWGLTGATAWSVGGIALTFIIFDIIWSSITTFRGFSMLLTYSDALMVGLIFSLPFMLTRRVWVTGVIMLLLDALLIANLMYCRTYIAAIPLSSYFLAGNLRDFGPSVLASLRWFDIVLPMFTVLWWILGRRMLSRSVQWRRYGLWLAATLVIFVGVNWLQKGFVNRVQTMLNSCYNSTVTTVVYTVFGNIIYDALTTTDKITPEQQYLYQTWMHERDTHHPYKPLPPDSVGQPRTSMVLILLESFEPWLIGAEVEGQELTPTLNAIVADSTTFYAPKVVTQVSSGRSIDAQLMVNAGLLPRLSKVYSVHNTNNTYPTLAKALAERGGEDFHSWLLSPDKPYVWNQGIIAREFGIETQLTEDDWESSRYTIGPGKGKLPDRDLADQIVKRMTDGEIWPVGSDAFVQIVMYSTHNPFILPEPLQEVEFSSEVPKMMDRYMQVARYTDGAVKIMMDYLRSRPDFDNTLVVIMGDHEGLAGDRSAILDTPIGRKYVDAEQFTPFIVVNSPVAGVYDKPMGQIDIYPTLLNLLGLDDYEWKGLGESVFNDTKIPAAINQLTLRLVGDADTAQEQYLREARTVSDIIIAFDMLK